MDHNGLDEGVMNSAITGPRSFVVGVLVCLAAAFLLQAHTATLEVDAGGGAPYTTIQSAIDDAIPGQDDVFVRCGLYLENIVLRDDVPVQGEAPGCTIIEGDFGSVVTADAVGASTVLQGFTIRHQEGTTGRGVEVHEASPVITRNIIEGNSSAGVAIQNISQELTPVISYNVIRGNQGDYGGAVSSRGSARMVSNLMVGNYGYYATVYTLYGNVEMVNNTISHNHGVLGGAIFAKASTDLILVNNVIGFNENELPAWGAAGLTVLGGSTVDFQSNDVFGNLPDDFYNVEDPTGTNGNISADPRFLDAHAWTFNGFQPRSDSPLVDAGSDTGTPSSDLRGIPRPLDGNADGVDQVDIGVRENEGITGLRFAGSELIWDHGKHEPETYNVYRGDLRTLIETGAYVQDSTTVDGARHFCALTATSLVDSDDPLEQQVFIYLVTAVGDVEGGLGFDSTAAHRPKDLPCQDF
jgi:hypothetical protein